MSECSNPDCDEEFGYDAGVEDPDPESQGHIAVVHSPEDKSFIVEDRAYYCSVPCLRADADNHPFGNRLPEDILKEADERFQESDLGSMTLRGPFGYHTFFTDEDTSISAAFQTALHATIDEVLARELWVDEDIIEDEYGEVTPENAAKLAIDQMQELTGIRFDSWTEDTFEEQLAEKLNDYTSSGGEEA